MQVLMLHTFSIDLISKDQSLTPLQLQWGLVQFCAHFIDNLPIFIVLCFNGSMVGNNWDSSWFHRSCIIFVELIFSFGLGSNFNDILPSFIVQFSIQWRYLANWRSIFQSIHRILKTPLNLAASLVQCTAFQHSLSFISSVFNDEIWIIGGQLNHSWIHKISLILAQALGMLSAWLTIFQHSLSFVPVISNGENLVSWRFLAAFHEGS